MTKIMDLSSTAYIIYGIKRLLKNGVNCVKLN